MSAPELDHLSAESGQRGYAYMPVPGGVCIDVAGDPAPKGNWTPVTRRSKKTGRAVTKLIPQSEREVFWSELVAIGARAARQHMRSAGHLGQGPLFEGLPLRIHIDFRIARPKSHYTAKGALKASAPMFPDSKPDGDKLDRAVWDALKKGQIIDDDCRFVRWSGEKNYVGAGHDGARITVTRLI